MAKRTRRIGVNRRLADVATPVFLLSDRRKVLFFNAGCEQLTGWSADDVAGSTCEYQSEAPLNEVESITGRLCPPPEVLAGRTIAVPVHLESRDGRTHARMVHFTPLVNAAGDVESVLGVIGPITEPVRSPSNPVQKLHAELASLRTNLRRRFGLSSLVGTSVSMHRVLRQIHLAAGSDAPLTILGESGVGKEHVARVIHHEGPRRARAFVPLDCRASAPRDLNRTLTRLFATDEPDVPSASIPGLSPGTLYVNNVDLLPRDLQELVVAAVNGDPADSAGRLRLIAAGSFDLRSAFDDDVFTPEFHHLIASLVIEVPPLRTRTEDLEPLAQSILESVNRGDERQIAGFSEAVWQQFREYNWPGNVDELAAVVQEARTACVSEAAGDLVEQHHLPFRFRTGLDAQTVGPAPSPVPSPLEPLLERVEREQIERALRQSGGNKSAAAKLLDVSRQKLYHRMEALGIEDAEDA